MKKLYIASKNKTGLTGSDHEPLIDKFRHKLKKVGKTTRPFMYGLNLIDRVPEDLWTEVHDIVQETGIKTIPKRNKWKKAKWLSKEALKIAVK